MMVVIICKPVFALAIILLAGQTYCSVVKSFQDGTENGVEEFLMSSEEVNDEDGNSPQVDENDELSNTSTRVVKTLTVTNGGPWGDWGPAQFCEDGSYAVGYDMKIEPKKRFDNTALNAVKLLCEFPDGDPTGGVTSTVGHWGSWVGPVRCKSRMRQRVYLTSFDLQVEKKRGWKDDTAANYVKFKCRDNCRDLSSTVLVKPPGHGLWGTWGSWSAECPKHTAICGIKTKVEKPQGSCHDDTALNDVMFYCCL